MRLPGGHLQYSLCSREDLFLVFLPHFRRFSSFDNSCPRQYWPDKPFFGADSWTSLASAHPPKHSRERVLYSKTVVLDLPAVQSVVLHLLFNSRMTHLFRSLIIIVRVHQSTRPNTCFLSVPSPVVFLLRVPPVHCSLITRKLPSFPLPAPARQLMRQR